MANLLSSSRATTSAVYKAKELHSTTETSDIFLSQVLPPLLQYLTRTLKPPRQPGRITAADRILADTATHIDTLKLALPLCCATLASLRQIHSFLWHGLQRQGPLHAHVHLAAQLLFVDCPAVLSEVSPVVLRGIAATCAPQVSVPHHCSLSLMLATCRDTYGCLHQLRCGLQVWMHLYTYALHHYAELVYTILEYGTINSLACQFLGWGGEVRHSLNYVSESILYVCRKHLKQNAWHFTMP